jgi:hypothetical protein
MRRNTVSAVTNEREGRVGSLLCKQIVTWAGFVSRAGSSVRLARMQCELAVAAQISSALCGLGTGAEAHA